MRIENVYIEDFKNLKKFNIAFHPSDEIVETVLLGQNASGKSNFIEALVLIFKYLDLYHPKRQSNLPKGNDYFEYKINYRIY